MPATPNHTQANEMAHTLTTLLPRYTSVQWLDSTGSTNLDLLERARQPAQPAMPWLLGADRQLTARGRAGRPWQNAAGSTLMFSCAFQVSLPIDRLPGLSPVLGIAACEAVRALIEADSASSPAQTASTSNPSKTACETYATRAMRLQLKWPNDLLWDQAKLAGILVESVHTSSTRTPIIVAGIGLNLKDSAALSTALHRAIADWSQISKQPSSRIVACIAQAWATAIEQYTLGEYAAFRERFDHVDALAGQVVDVTDKGNILQTGRAMGTDSIGRLLVQTSHGTTAVMVGDISIRQSDRST